MSLTLRKAGLQKGTEGRGAPKLVSAGPLKRKNHGWCCLWQEGGNGLPMLHQVDDLGSLCCG